MGSRGGAEDAERGVGVDSAFSAPPCANLQRSDSRKLRCARQTFDGRGTWPALRNMYTLTLFADPPNAVCWHRCKFRPDPFGDPESKNNVVQKSTRSGALKMFVSKLSRRSHAA